MRYLSRWFILLLDLILCSIAFLFSSAVLSRFIPSLPAYGSVGLLFYQLLIVLTIQLCCFMVVRPYRSVLRFSTFRDLVRLLLCQLICVSVLLGVEAFTSQLMGRDLFVGLSFVVYFVSSLTLMSFMRIAVRVMFEISFQSRQRLPMLIMGDRDSNVNVARMLKGDLHSPYKIVGMAEEKLGSGEKMIMNVPLITFEDKEVVQRFIKEHGVTHVLVTSAAFLTADIAHVMMTLNDWGMKLLRLPKVDVMTAERDASEPLRIQPIRIEDLLNREPIVLTDEKVSECVRDNVVMVTGAAGSIGSELVRQLSHHAPKTLILLDNAETPLHAIKVELEAMPQQVPFITVVVDIRNALRMEQLISQYRPKVLYHAAAYKHVPMMEENPSEAILTNVMGTKIVADCCMKYGVERMVMISTDKAVNPSNVMGASKRIAEIYVQSLNTAKEEGLLHSSCSFITTRFGNVLGSNGSVIPFFRKQIEEGGPVKVTHPDIIRYFMTIPEACQLVLQAGTMGQGGEIYIFDMGEPVKILDLATRMIRLAGYVPYEDIDIAFTGLRPGEKLYEELLNTKELTKPTYNEKIHIAHVQHFEYMKVNENLKRLVEMARDFDQDAVVQQMKDVVPEFVSQNSVYEKFDVRMKVRG